MNGKADLLDALPIAKAFDLRVLQDFLPAALASLKTLIARERLRRKQAGTLYDWVDESMLTTREVVGEWLTLMLATIAPADFRAKAALFTLHHREIARDLAATGRDSALVYALRDAVSMSICNHGTPERAIAAAGFSHADLVVHACNIVGQLLTERRVYEENYVHHAERRTVDKVFWTNIDHPEGRERIRTFCQQLGRNQLWFRSDGSFSPEADASSAPTPVAENAVARPLLSCAANAGAMKALLVNALARDWMGADDAERIVAQHPLLEPWALLGHASDDYRRTSGSLRTFVANLRRRFPLAIDKALATGEGAEPEIDLYSCSWNIPGLAGKPVVALYGSAGLLAAGQWLRTHPKPKKCDEPDSDDIELLVKRIAYIAGLDSGEKAEEVVARLRQLPSATLLTLLPWSGAAQPLVLRAANLEALEPLRQWMLDSTRVRTGDRRSTGDDLLRNDPDPRLGVVDVAGLSAAVRGVSAKEIKILAGAYSKAGMMPGIDKLLATFGGENDRERLLHAAGEKLQQPAMKLLGLQPLIGDDDLRQRYLTLQRLYKEAGKHGAQRQATQRAAALVGLANLAQLAGYRDSSELEWVLESSEGPAIRASLQPQAIGETWAWIEIDGFSAELRFSNRAGKLLAAAPAAIRREAALATLKSSRAEIREQFRRFGRLMETRMIQAAPVDPAQLVAALAHPVMAPIIGGLVWQDEAGACGLFSADGLLGPAGTQAVGGNALRPAHPVSLLQRPDGAALLSRWQRWLYEQQRVQPFKQLFREIYVPTPVELEGEDDTLSSRYAGRRIRTGVAQSLFQARGWIPGNEDSHWSLPLGDGLAARCAYAGGHYFTENPETELLHVGFLRRGAALPLAEVPPACFSEAMRDLDLVVTVAMLDDSDEFREQYTSSSSVATRIDLLRAIAPSLGEGVLEFQERHVLVRGKRAAYRIHLASGHVYVEPGAYLCIIPAAAGGRSKLRLPYAEEDFKTAEIVSKVVLLAHDDEIGDESILRQIQGRPG